MITTNKSGIFRLIDQCVAYGMTHFVCSPGSRNAPLIIAIDNHPGIEAFVIHDERSAAFYALGMAQQLEAPVGLVCTSGSAMLNYYPAVAEAYYQCVPLVVISADRPEEWVNHGDGQTIVQKNVYTNHIRYETQVKEIISESDYESFDRELNNLFSAALGGWRGPVHINCPISEPMYETVEVIEESFTPKQVCVESQLSSQLIEELRKEWDSSGKRMILCGQMDKSPLLLTKLSELANDNSITVLVENTSNLAHPKFNHCIDRTLSSISAEELKEFNPDLLITIGGAIISKRIKSFLRNSDVKSHWKVGYEFPEMDTYRKLTRSIQCQPFELFEGILSWDMIPHKSNFGLKWKKKDYINQDKVDAFIASAPYSDLTVFELLLDYLPEDSILHMANSSVVRYCQLFDPVGSIKYYSNRGTSGIDGSTSTAAGASLIAKHKLNVLITGDVSFFYDSNAFWNNYVDGNLRVILINNSGGGIFRIIDGPATTSQLEKYFETKQSFNAAKLCEAFGVGYFVARSLDEIEAVIPAFLGQEDYGRPQVLEVFTPNLENDKVLKEFFKCFK